LFPSLSLLRFFFSIYLMDIQHIKELISELWTLRIREMEVFNSINKAIPPEYPQDNHCVSAVASIDTSTAASCTTRNIQGRRPCRDH
jgi:hypothetical protein